MGCSYTMCSADMRRIRFRCPYSDKGGVKFYFRLEVGSAYLVQLLKTGLKGITECKNQERAKWKIRRWAILLPNNAFFSFKKIRIYIGMYSDTIKLAAG